MSKGPTMLERWSFQQMKNNALSINYGKVNPHGPTITGALQSVQNQQREAPFPGDPTFGGNDPLVIPNDNNPIAKTILISADNKPYDSHPGALIFESRMNTKMKNYRSPVLRKSVGAMNYYLKVGDGRRAYGPRKSCETFLRDWALTGVQWTIPALPGSVMSTDYQLPSETIHVGGCTRMKNFWTTRHSMQNPGSRKRKRSAYYQEKTAVEGQYLWLFLRRVEEENPYAEAFCNDMYDKSLSEKWKNRPIEDRFYWRIDPYFSETESKPCVFYYKSDDATGVNDYQGHCYKVGLLMERDTRQGVNPENALEAHAVNYLYPQNDKGTYIEDYNKLGTILIRRMY